MKYCPACNFSFPDFHHVCDFDGTELVPEPERKPAINPGSSRLRSALKSPAFLSVLLSITLLSSAILIGYLDVRQSPPQVRSQPVAPSNVVSPDEVPEQSSRALSHPWHRRYLSRLSVSVASARREAKAGHFLSRSHPRTSVERAPAAEVSMRKSSPQAPKEKEPRTTAFKDVPKATPALNTSFVAHKAPQPVPPQKEPKLTAMLKTTWHVLKKPFKF